MQVTLIQNRPVDRNLVKSFHGLKVPGERIKLIYTVPDVVSTRKIREADGEE